jgi:hypothetical protein
MTKHDGEVVPNADCPVGTVLAYDATGELFYYVGSMNRHERTLKGHWPRVKDGVIQLYRDYWRHIASGADTPYGASFRNAPHRVLREVKP